MKRIRLFLAFSALALAFPSAPARADEFSDNFSANLTQASLDALARDVGSLMGGSSFHEGKALGFPIGFDIGVHAPIIGVDPDDKILRDDGGSAHALWGQIEYGLPGRINLIGRIGELYDANLLGGGLRWGVFSPSVPGLPAVSVSAIYTKLDHEFFDGETYSGNVAASFDIPFIHPYIGVGYDKTTVDPTARAFVAAAPGTSTSLDGDGDGFRVEAGVNVSVIPFTYLTIGGGIANGRKLGHLGLGVRI